MYIKQIAVVASCVLTTFGCGQSEEEKLAEHDAKVKEIMASYGIDPVVETVTREAVDDSISYDQWDQPVYYEEESEPADFSQSISVTTKDQLSSTYLEVAEEWLEEAVATDAQANEVYEVSLASRAEELAELTQQVYSVHELDLPEVEREKLKVDLMRQYRVLEAEPVPHPWPGVEEEVWADALMHFEYCIETSDVDTAITVADTISENLQYATAEQVQEWIDTLNTYKRY